MNISVRGFVAVQTVTFNQQPALQFKFSGGMVAATVPPGATTGEIAVVAPPGQGGSAVSRTPFRVTTNADRPMITSFSPTSGTVGTTVTINGTNLAFGVNEKPTVEFFNNQPAEVTSFSSTQIQVKVPANATTGPIRVTNCAGVAASSTFTRDIGGPPVITSVTPPEGAPGASISIVGNNFDFTATVEFFNQAAATIDRNRSTDRNLVVTVPQNAMTGKIKVTTRNGSVFSTEDFRVLLPPQVDSITPTSGPAGTEVTVRGNGFQSVTSVAFQGPDGVRRQVTFARDGAQQLRLDVPQTAVRGPNAIIVRNGIGAAANQPIFNVCTVPAITSVTPASGATGTEVTINGTNLNSTQSVKFNGVAATFAVDMPTKIRATVPAGVSGPVQLCVMTACGQACASFTVNGGCLQPTITNASPANAAPGASVTINGTNFGSVQSVKFNSVAATFVRDSETQIRATVPQGLSGSVQLCVATNCGQACVNYTVGGGGACATTITSISPASGAAGTEVTISGTNFNNASAVHFNNNPATFFTVLSNTTIRATVRAGTTTGPVTVTTPCGTASGPTFSVTSGCSAPTISGLSPATGSVGATVTINGANFTSVQAVSFNGTAATFTVLSATQIRATVPQGASSGPLSVTTACGSASRNFTVLTIVPPLPPPTGVTITDFNPKAGPAGTSVIITGAGFDNAAVVTFNGATASRTVNSATQITAIVPTGASTGLIRVDEGLAGSATSALSFTVSASGGGGGGGGTLAAPTNLTATGTTAPGIDLTWNHNGANLSGFKLERKTSTSAFVEIATFPASARVYSDSLFSTNVTYTYRIRAFNSAGNSDYSNEASARPLRPLGQ